MHRKLQTSTLSEKSWMISKQKSRINKIRQYKNHLKITSLAVLSRTVPVRLQFSTCTRLLRKTNLPTTVLVQNDRRNEFTEKGENPWSRGFFKQLYILPSGISGSELISRGVEHPRFRKISSSLYDNAVTSLNIPVDASSRHWATVEIKNSGIEKFLRACRYVIGQTAFFSMTSSL